MANPQIENGFTRIANELLEALSRTRFAGQESRVLLHVIRMTYGYRKKSASIALNDVVAATGMRKERCCEALASLLEREVLKVEDEDGVRRLSIQTDYEQWVDPERKRKKINVTEKRNDSLRKNVLNVTEKRNDSLRKNVINVTEKRNAPITAIKKKENKENKEKEYIYFYAEFEKLWKMYPLKDGRSEALAAFQQSVRQEADMLAIKRALANYQAHLAANPWKSPKTGRVWFSNWRDWSEHVELSREDAIKTTELLSELKAEVSGAGVLLDSLSPERRAAREKALRSKERVIELVESGAWSLAVYDEFVRLGNELRLLAAHDSDARRDLSARIVALFSVGKQGGGCAHTESE